MKKKEEVFDLETFCLALADRTRLRLLNLMGDDEVCVCFFVEVLDEPQAKISRHLAYLRRAGLVETRRDGKWIHYHVIAPKHPHAAKMFAEIRAWLAEESDMRRDREQLARVCCAPRLPVQLMHAPRPTRLAQTART